MFNEKDECEPLWVVCGGVCEQNVSRVDFIYENTDTAWQIVVDSHFLAFLACKNISVVYSNPVCSNN